LHFCIFIACRNIDDRLQGFAAMKLGRVGKSGLDANTVSRRSRGTPLLTQSTSRNTFISTNAESYFPSAEQQSTIMWGLGSTSLVLVILAVVFAVVAVYWKKVQRAFYVNELS
jgi:hypothetical protein